MENAYNCNKMLKNTANKMTISRANTERKIVAVVKIITRIQLKL